MTHSEFNHLLSGIAALSPEQMRRLRDELNGKLAATAAAGQPGVISQGSPEQPGAGQEETAPDYKPIWEVAEEIRKRIPAEEWAKLPTDGARQLDHYLYGSPKQPTA